MKSLTLEQGRDSHNGDKTVVTITTLNLQRHSVAKYERLAYIAINTAPPSALVHGGAFSYLWLYAAIYEALPPCR